MTRLDRHHRLLAASLSALAGYVDATGFLKLGGFFVSFMSGNSTRLAVGLAQGTSAALEATILVCCFVTGVIAGSLVGRLGGPRRRVFVLAAVAALLAVAAALGDSKADSAAIAAMALAMGAENAVFEQDGDVQVGLTYMTGTLVKIGQRLATALMGGPRMAFAPYLLLWLGLIAGAVLGALDYGWLELNSLWIAAGFALICAVAAARIQPEG